MNADCLESASTRRLFEVSLNTLRNKATRFFTIDSLSTASSKVQTLGNGIIRGGVLFFRLGPRGYRNFSCFVFRVRVTGVAAGAAVSTAVAVEVDPFCSTGLDNVGEAPSSDLLSCRKRFRWHWFHQHAW